MSLDRTFLTGLLPVAGRSQPGSARAMTRCECAGVLFEAIARRMSVDGASLGDVMKATGAGRMCSACLPDLHAFTAQFRPPPD